MRNALTVDVEDWYMTNGLDIDPSEWHRFEDRVVPNTTVLLDLFDRYNVKGTFFVLGCVAQKHPQLVEEIARRGHEIGSHGGWHRLVTTQTLEQFREDLRFSKQTLEGITGQRIELYRAPSWSIAPSRFGALKILAEEGFVCDSSMQPFQTPLSGIAGAPVKPFRPVLDGEPLGLTEFPPTVAEVGGMKVPFSGGFYLRAVPYPLIKWALKRVNRTRSGMIYVHPWEVDTQQPKIKTSAFIRVIQYYGLTMTERKLDRLLRDFAFEPLGGLISGQSYAPHPLHTPEPGRPIQ
jgi:polysaccharide deacetylase family protein (PEP-CTERM system associated)